MPAFQPLLLENDLPNVLISVVQNDSEPYVRASALSCLYYMVQVESVWNSVLKEKSLLVCILSFSLIFSFSVN